MPRPDEDRIVRANLYLTEGLITRIDAYAEKLSATDPFKRTITRTDAVRLLLTEALKRVAEND